jgi:hypothetical protein
MTCPVGQISDLNPAVRRDEARYEKGAAAQVGRDYRCSGPSPVVSAAFGRWPGFVLMMTALLVVLALGLFAILVVSKGATHLTGWTLTALPFG